MRGEHWRSALCLLVPCCLTAGCCTGVNRLIRFDARHGTVTRHVQHEGASRPATDPPPSPPLDSSPFYRASDIVTIEVANARCDAVLKLEVDEREVPDSAPAVRGLESMEGLAASLLVPPAKAGGAVGEMTMPEEGALLGRLGSLGEAVALESELEEDLRHLQAALERARELVTDYEEDVCFLTHRLKEDPAKEDRPKECPAKECPATATPQPLGTPVLDELEDELQAMLAALNGVQPNDCGGLNAAARQLDQIGELTSTVRHHIESGKAGSGAAIATQVDDLLKRAGSYKGKLDRVHSAATIAAELPAFTPSIGAILARSKRLKEMYGEGATAEAIRQVAEDTGGWHEKQRLKKEMGELSARTRPSEETGDVSKVQESGGRKAGAPAGKREADLRRKADHLAREGKKLRCRLRAHRSAFERRVRDVDASLAGAARALTTKYAASTTTRAMATLGPWSSGQTAIIRLLERRAPATPSRRPPELASAGQLEDDVAPASASEDLAYVNSIAIKVHRQYRLGIGAALVYRSRRAPEFSVRSVPRSDANGSSVFDEGGNPVVDEVAWRSGDGRLTDYAAMLLWYPKVLDVFPGGNAERPMLGVAGGVSMYAPLDHQYVGVFAQPTLGVQFIGGLHVAQRTELQDGVVEGRPLPSSAGGAALTTGTTLGWFVSLGLDARIFRVIFGGGS